MINSRSLDELHPKVKAMTQEFLDRCHAEGINVMITSTYRDFESQNDLYAQGRTTAGSIVTNAKGGDSYHNYRLAFDFCPVVNGKAMWSETNLFNRCGAIAESIGLEWAGHWKGFKELAHCQATGGLSLAQLKSGREPVFA